MCLKRSGRWVVGGAMGSLCLVVLVGGGERLRPKRPMRQVAALGPAQNDTQDFVWETTIAAGASRLVAASNQGLRNPGDITTRQTRFAAAQVVSGQWQWTQEGLVPFVPPAPNDNSVDGVLAYNSVTDDFLLISLARGPTGNLAVAGTWQDDDLAENAGAAYVFAVGPDDDGDGVMDACVCTGDINADWKIDHEDLGILLGEYNMIPGEPLQADLNGDNAVNQQDLGILLANYGRVCP